MKIEHLAIWVRDLEKMKKFYETYFDARSNELYHNPKKNFTSYFLSFSEGCRLELMHRPDIASDMKYSGQEQLGIIHFAVSVGTRELVNSITEQLRNAGYTVTGNPRTTGDGYYESVVLDPEGNRIEITV